MGPLQYFQFASYCAVIRCRSPIKQVLRLSKLMVLLSAKRHWFESLICSELIRKQSNNPHFTVGAQWEEEICVFDCVIFL